VETRTGVLAPAYLLLGNICYATRDWPGVIRSCDRFLRFHPDHPTALNRKAIALIRWGHPEKAVPGMERARGLAPGSWTVFALLVEACVRAGQRDRARELVEVWLDDHPDDPSAWRALGWLRWAGGDVPGALQAYRRSLAAEPDMFQAADELSLLVLETEGEQPALEALREVLPTTCWKTEIRYLMGRVLLIGDFRSEEGLELLMDADRAGMELEAPRTGCSVILLRALVDRERFDEAVGAGVRFEARTKESGEFTMDALGLRPEHAEAFNLFGVALYRTGDFEAAELNYHRALRLVPDDVAALNNLAELLACAPGSPDRIQEALKHAARAVELAPDLPEVHDTLGIARLAASDVEGAIEAFRACLRLAREGIAAEPRTLDPHRASRILARTWVRLAKALATKGERGEARTALREARRSRPGIESDPEYLAAARMLE
jgi:tetratricopeptide (TPR) repeat protein